MLNPRMLLLLVLALGAAGAAAYVVNGLAVRRPAAPVPAATAQPVVNPTVKVLVAKRELPTGAFVKAADLDWRDWPEAGLPETFTRAGKGSEKDFEGAVVRNHLFAGEPIVRNRLVQPGDRGFLAAVLAPGRRAVAVPIDAARGAGGFIFPGDRVDVLLSLKQTPAVEDGDDAGTRYFAETLLTDVRVLAIDQSVDLQNGQAKTGKTATLEVTPKQAEQLALGSSLGDLSLSLRSLQTPETSAARPLNRSGDSGMSGATPLTPAAGPATSPAYTRDTDVLFMIGDPWGLPPVGGFKKKVNVLRGSSDPKEIRY
jgi:pilus assembly protein CpaB